VTLHHSPKTFWCTLFPQYHAHPLDIDPQSIFSHTTSSLTFSDIFPPVFPPFSPLSCHLFSERDIRGAVRVMSTSRSADKEGFQAEFLKHGIQSLDSHIANLFILTEIGKFELYKAVAMLNNGIAYYCCPEFLNKIDNSL
jgi:hypothetical protein